MKLRSFIATGAIVLTGGAALAQSGSNTGIGIHFGGYDFYGPQTNSYLTARQTQYTFNDSLGGYTSSKKNRIVWRPLVKLSYWREFSQNFTLSSSLSFASLEYPNGKNDTVFVNKVRANSAGDRDDRFLGEWDFRFNYNILPRKSYIVSPYVFAGINASYHNYFFGADVPLGLGLNIGLDKSRDLSLNLESAYKVAATSHDVNHLQHTIGLIYWFRPGYRPAQTAATEEPVAALTPQAPDRDNDGIVDSEDQCPDIPGMAQFNGCPDSDGDGIGDKDDACPLVAGLAQFSGCPDSDGDGIADNSDKCPYVPGAADRQGCPVPDKDNDGYTDDVDRCPDVYSKTNQGCPEIRKEVITQVERAAKAIFFETGKASLKPISNKSLDAIVSVLNADPSLYADIEGHTDNVVPKSYTNMELSQNRADAVKNYLVSKGISADRLTAQGFGDTQPVADNATAAGKAQNRRTVIKLRNFSK